MSKNNKESSVIEKAYKFFASVKLTIILLLTLAGTSAVGTLIPQNADPAGYFRAYGEFFYRLFSMLDLYNMYYSWWFELLILLLAVNIIICSVDRLGNIWKIVFSKNPSFRLKRFQNSRIKEVFTDKRSTEDLFQASRKITLKHFGNVVVEKQADGGRILFAEKWRWTRLGVYIVHFSIVLLLIGALIGSLFGYEGFINIPEGESANAISLRFSGKQKLLPFEIRCNDFDVSFYRTGEPKEFRSSLTLLDNDNNSELLTKDIIVNRPLRYKGINIFQSSYGTMAPEEPPRTLSPEEVGDEVMLAITSVESGMGYEKKARIGESLELPEGLGKFVLMEYQPSADFSGQNIGGAFIGILTPADGEPVQVMLPVAFPNFDRMRRGKAVLAVRLREAPGHAKEPEEKQPERYYTGLQVSRDPGVWVVYTGFIFMILGCLIAFFMSHRQICIEITKAGKKSRIMVAGTADKNKLGMREKIKNISRMIQATE